LIPRIWDRCRVVKECKLVKVSSDSKDLRSVKDSKDLSKVMECRDSSHSKDLRLAKDRLVRPSKDKQDKDSKECALGASREWPVSYHKARDNRAKQVSISKDLADRCSREVDQVLSKAFQVSHSSHSKEASSLSKACSGHNKVLQSLNKDLR
jgi:hypothetical protein